MRPARVIAPAAIVIAAALMVHLRADVPFSPNIGDLIAQARGLPAEFAADALIRLSGSSRLTPALRRELLDEAFTLAYAAHEAFRRSSTMALQPESRQSAERFAYESGLTRVTLQARAAQLLAFTDPPRARELFEWIDAGVAPGHCEDPLVPAVDEYYSALSIVARTTFAGNRAEAVRFLERHLWRARLPSEIPAVARAVERFRPTLDEAIYLQAVVRWILEGTARDPRGFSSASLDIVSRVAELQHVDHERGVPGWYLLDGLREYLIDRLGEPRCADSTTEPMVAAAFNGVLGPLGAGREVDRIDETTLRPAKRLAPAHIDYYWQTADSRRLHRDVERLRTDGTSVYAERVRQTKEWLDQADLLLTAIEQWPGRREASERDYFYQKSTLFTGIVDLAPRGSVHTRAVRALVDFLRQTDTDRERRALWLAMVNRCLELARSDPSGEMFALMAESHHPVLSMYAQLEQVARERTSR